MSLALHSLRVYTCVGADWRGMCSSGIKICLVVKRAAVAVLHLGLTVAW